MGRAHETRSSACLDCPPTSGLTSSATFAARQRRPSASTKPLVAFGPWSAPRPGACVGQRRRAGEPEADEQRQGLDWDRDMALEPLDLPGHAVEPSRERGFQPIGAVRRQERRERRLDDRAPATRACALHSRRADQRVAVGRRKRVLGAHRLTAPCRRRDRATTWRAMVLDRGRCMIALSLGGSSGSRR